MEYISQFKAGGGLGSLWRLIFGDCIMLGRTDSSVAGPLGFGVGRSMRAASRVSQVLLWGVVAASLLALAGCNLGAANFAGTKTMSVPTGGAASTLIESSFDKPAGASKTISGVDLMPGVNAGVFDISSANGTITVEPSTDGTFSVTAQIKATTQERLDACELSVVPGSGGGLTIRILWPGGVEYSQEGASITVKAPVRTGLTLKTSNGEIKATAVTGAVRARTGNGKISIKDVGGAVDVRTSNGGVAVSGAAAAVTADTSNGFVTVTMADNAAGPCIISTSNGGVKLSIGPGMSGTATMKTSNGGITLGGRPFEKQTVSKSSASVEFGVADGPASSIRTSNGTIEVTRR